jgi:hypothetical protein
MALHYCEGCGEALVARDYDETGKAWRCEPCRVELLCFGCVVRKHAGHDQRTGNERRVAERRNLVELPPEKIPPALQRVAVFVIFAAASYAIGFVVFWRYLV